MGVIHIVSAAASHDGECDVEKVGKVFMVCIWVMITLAIITFFICLDHIWFGIALLVFIITVRICVAIWKKDNEKNIKENEDN